MIEVLEKRKSMFLAFGWHKQAAWFSISGDKFREFKTDILAEVNKLDFKGEKNQIDITKIVSLDELGFKFLSKVNSFKPFWMGNPKPVFMVEDLSDFKTEILWNKSRDHLKFTTSHGFKMFAFYMWDFYEEIKRATRDWKSLSLVFDISEDVWMGKKNLMLKVVDVVLG
jgi:single-stranded-DNA-specific exonuclease